MLGSVAVVQPRSPTGSCCDPAAMAKDVGAAPGVAAAEKHTGSCSSPAVVGPALAAENSAALTQP